MFELAVRRDGGGSGELQQQAVALFTPGDLVVSRGCAYCRPRLSLWMYGRVAAASCCTAARRGAPPQPHVPLAVDALTAAALRCAARPSSAGGGAGA